MRAYHRHNPQSRLEVRPRLVITRTHVMVITVSVLAAVVLGTRLLFAYVESMRGYDDMRDDQMTVVLAALAALACAVIMVRLHRRPKPSDLASHE